MNTRLSQFIAYASSGNKAEFARIVGWSPQYLNSMLKECRIGINPVMTLLEKFPELNARWLLLGEGAMLTSGVDAVKQRLLRLLEIERYLQVMTAEEQQQVIDGNLDFDDDTLAKWQHLLMAKNAERNARFDDAFARQKRWLEERKNG